MSRVVVLSLSFIACLLILEVNYSAHADKIPGHRRPLGAHMKPYGVTVIGKFSSPQVFFGHFVKATKPIHMKSALTETKHPGMEWTDEYLRAHYGREMVRVEVGKKEVRKRNAQWMRMTNFLDDYADNDLYMVHSIKGPMEELVYIPNTLQCGGFEKSVVEAVVWMGRGPLHSVLHYDELENLLCVFDGTKDVTLIDKFYKDKVESRGFVDDGHYSRVDPESVDMHTFPQFQNLPWHRVHLDPGDCIYIPYGWYHQVTTYGDRSLALNIWFSHIWWFNDDSCENFSSFPYNKPLAKFGGFASPNELLRSRWLEKFEGSDDDVSLKDFSRRVATGTEDELKKAFSLIDQDEDGELSWEELTSFDITKALPQFPSVFYPNPPSTHNPPEEGNPPEDNPPEEDSPPEDSPPEDDSPPEKGNPPEDVGPPEKGNRPEVSQSSRGNSGGHIAEQKRSKHEEL